MAVKDIDNLTVGDIKPITISFKKNEDELILYKWILSHSGYSGFVKDELKAIMRSEKNVAPSTTQVLSRIKQEQSDSLIELDF